MSHSSAGRKAQPPRYRFRTEAYEQFQLIHVNQGELHCSDASGKVLLKPGGVALLREGSAFTLWTEQIGYAGVFLIAAGTERPELRGTASAFQGSAGTRQLAGLMAAEAAAFGPGTSDLLLNLGWALTWLAIRLDQRRHASRGEEAGAQVAETARQVLEASIYTGQGARKVLSSLGLSYRQLSRYFLQTHGVSPKQYQLHARLREAERLLRNTKHSVTEIAFELGYSSSQHFATHFTAHAKCSPTEFRKRKCETAQLKENRAL
jgi:AraC-like DNA-binding protein